MGIRQLALDRDHRLCPKCESWFQVDMSYNNICPVCGKDMAKKDLREISEDIFRRVAELGYIYKQMEYEIKKHDMIERRALQCETEGRRLIERRKRRELQYKKEYAFGLFARVGLKRASVPVDLLSLAMLRKDLFDAIRRKRRAKK